MEIGRVFNPMHRLLIGAYRKLQREEHAFKAAVLARLRGVESIAEIAEVHR